MSWKDMFDFKASRREGAEAAAKDRRPGERWYQTDDALLFIVLAPPVIGLLLVLLIDKETLFLTIIIWLCFLWPVAMIMWARRKEISWKDAFDFKTPWREFAEAAAASRRPGDRWYESDSGMLFILLGLPIIGGTLALLLLDGPESWILGALSMILPFPLLFWRLVRDHASEEKQFMKARIEALERQISDGRADAKREVEARMAEERAEAGRVEIARYDAVLVEWRRAEAEKATAERAEAALTIRRRTAHRQMKRDV